VVEIICTDYAPRQHLIEIDSKKEREREREGDAEYTRIVMALSAAERPQCFFEHFNKTWNASSGVRLEGSLQVTILGAHKHLNKIDTLVCVLHLLNDKCAAQTGT
jgi:hypothetical protein